MQILLKLNDNGFESIKASGIICSCKKGQKGYDITSHSGMDVMRYYKRLLKRYKCALETEISTLESVKSDVDRKCLKKRDASAGWAVGGGLGGLALLGASVVVPGVAIIGAAAAAMATGGFASGKAGKTKEN